MNTDREKLEDTATILQHKSVTALIEWIARGNLQRVLTDSENFHLQQNLLTLQQNCIRQFEEKQQRIGYLELQCAEHERQTSRLSQELQELNISSEQHKQRVQEAKSENADLKKKVSKLEAQLETLKSKGLRLRNKENKPLCDVTSSTTLTQRKHQLADIVMGSNRKRQCVQEEYSGRDRMSEEQTVSVSKQLSQSGLERILAPCTELLRKCLEKNHQVSQSLIEDTLATVRSKIGGEAILRLCDEGLSDSLYHKLIQLLKAGLRAAGLADHCCPLPCVGQKRAQRASLNREVEELLNIQQVTLTDDMQHRTLDSDATSFKVDVPKLIESLIIMYGMEEQTEIHIKLQIDETPFYGDRKLERASIKIMNYALNRSLRAFKIQSENELFPIALAYVQKENAEALLMHFSNWFGTSPVT